MVGDGRRCSAFAGEQAAAYDTEDAEAGHARDSQDNSTVTEWSSSVDERKRERDDDAERCAGDEYPGGLVAPVSEP